MTSRFLKVFYWSIGFSFLIFASVNLASAQGADPSGGGAERAKPGSFADLRDQRSQAIAAIPGLRSNLDRLKVELNQLIDQQRAQQTIIDNRKLSGPRSYLATEAEENIRRIKAINQRDTDISEAKVARLQADLERLEVESTGDDDTMNRIAALREQIAIEIALRAERAVASASDVRLAEAELRDLLQQSDQSAIAAEALLAAIDQQIEAKKLEIEAAESELQSKLDRQLAVENKINLLLIPETADHEFKLYITAAFAALVGCVIIGFFYVALTDDTVKRAIFSGQSGIQFLTLFSLVIAIILFGMTGILGDKELAALLGGISGYILGRVTPETAEIQPAGPDPAVAAPAAPATPAPPAAPAAPAEGGAS